LTYVNKPRKFGDSCLGHKAEVENPLKLFEKIIELLPGRIYSASRRFSGRTVSELEIITEVTSILLKHPFRLRLTALVVIIKVVVAAIETTAKIGLA